MLVMSPSLGLFGWSCYSFSIPALSSRDTNCQLEGCHLPIRMGINEEVEEKEELFTEQDKSAVSDKNKTTTESKFEEVSSKHADILESENKKITPKVRYKLLSLI